ncbi:hypothetical protein BDV59DRAFT_195406 [Aspergillus ambiguus]|uniref:C6 transcription factor RegA n=1 Tax=Aspergillus ambiguus TaxID=176160 RepID=UPI003CCE433C
MATPYASPKSVPAQPVNRNLYQCGTCTQSFSRIDHLSRHVRSHLLTRHSSLHNAEGDEHVSKKRRRNGSGPAIAPRASQACTACAENHLRCDEEKPCKRCQRRKIQCTVPSRQEDNLISTIISNAAHYEVCADQRFDSRAHVNISPYDAFASTSDDMAGHSAWSETQLPESPQKECQDLITPESASVFPSVFPLDTPSGVRTPRGLITFGFLETYNARIPFQFDEQVTPPSYSDSALGDRGTRGNYNATNDRSMQGLRWRFVPQPQDHGYAEHDNLLLPAQADQNSSPRTFACVDTQYRTEGLDLASRDKIMSIFLSQIRRPIYQDKLSFPSVELLDTLIRYFLTVPISNAKSWIHFATFNPNQTRPELLLAMAAVGAILTPDPSLRKLGFAMQEVVRHQLPVEFEADNTNIHNLELLQAYMLCLEIGLWSGNNRKMEICESSRLPLVTILRRRGFFHHSAYPPVLVGAADVNVELEGRWRLWVRQESFKRLVYNLLQHDAQVSMVLFTNPLLSYAEMSLPIPCLWDLWAAGTAENWKALYCGNFAAGSAQTPTLLECIANLDMLESTKKMVDTSLSCASILYGIILLASQSRYWDNGILITSRYQELIKMLNLLFNFMLMHMHMSLEEVQILATMEDPKTCEIPPSIHSWSRSKECREALWYAGQVIRELKLLAPHRLRDFMAVTLYHASLALWAYGLVKSVATETQKLTHLVSTDMNLENVIWLDGDDTDDVHRYIALERGNPALLGVQPGDPSISLADPSAILDMVIRLMHQNHSNESGTPLVDNLVHLIEKLRDVSK